MIRRLISAIAFLCPVAAAAVAQDDSIAAKSVLPKQSTAQVRGNTAFAMALYDRIRRDPGNVIVSPYSISSALAMTYDGARGETARQMANVLRFPLDRAQLHPAFQDLNSRLLKRSDGLELSIANALWGQANYFFHAEFLDATRQFYGAEMQRVDFAKPSEAVKTINAWVHRETRTKIPDILLPTDVDVDTRLVLTNAIYLKGQWANPFKKASTHEAEFRRLDGDLVRVAMMRHSKARFRYASVDGIEILELPYSGGKASMVLLLPSPGGDLAELEAELSPEKLAVWIERLQPRVVDVSLPRFKIEQNLRLVETLKKMDMPFPFDGRADFSGMTSPEGLYISAVIHKALVEVDEEGTVAAAATAVVMSGKSAVVAPHFNADRPFLFFIRDHATESILFMGRVVDPSNMRGK